MEDVEILRGIEIRIGYLEYYKELRVRIFRVYTILIIGGILVFPLFIITMLYSGQNNNFFSALIFFMWFLPLLIIGFYFISIVFKTAHKYAKLIEKAWLIWPASQIFYNRKIRYLIMLTSLEVFFVISILGYFAGDTFSICTSSFLLIIPPALYVAKKSAEKRGYTINHLFKGDVDEITDKLTISLSGKKKMLIKSQSSRRYMVEFQNPCNFKLFVSRRADKKEFTEVSIMGVKRENISEARHLISQIEESIG